jgi:hypothetical protein
MKKNPSSCTLNPKEKVIMDDFLKSLITGTPSNQSNNKTSGHDFLTDL